jgi:hypothetical protein
MDNTQFRKYWKRGYNPGYINHGTHVWEPWVLLSPSYIAICPQEWVRLLSMGGIRNQVTRSWKARTGCNSLSRWYRNTSTLRKEWNRVLAAGTMGQAAIHYLLARPLTSGVRCRTSRAPVFECFWFQFCSSLYWQIILLLIIWIRMCTGSNFAPDYVGRIFQYRALVYMLVWSKGFRMYVY